MSEREERLENELNDDERLDQLRTRIGERIDFGYNLTRMSGAELEVEQVSRQSYRLTLLTPKRSGAAYTKGEKMRWSLGMCRSTTELRERVEALHELLDWHRKTMQIDAAGQDGYLENPDTGQRTKVFDPETMRGLP